MGVLLPRSSMQAQEAVGVRTTGSCCGWDGWDPPFIWEACFVGVSPRETVAHCSPDHYGLLYSVIATE